MQDLSHYTELAEMFAFPGDGFNQRMESVAALVKKVYPEAESDMNKFVELIPDDLERTTELFTRSFDVQAVTTLDVGYVLFGELSIRVL